MFAKIKAGKPICIALPNAGRNKIVLFSSPGWWRSNRSSSNSPSTHRGITWYEVVLSWMRSIFQTLLWPFSGSFWHIVRVRASSLAPDLGQFLLGICLKCMRLFVLGWRYGWRRIGFDAANGILNYGWRSHPSRGRCSLSSRRTAYSFVCGKILLHRVPILQ